MLKSSIICSKKLLGIEKVFSRSCTSTVNGKWDLYAAICLERKPVITPELNELQKEYKALMADIEFERSLKSDHELRHEADLKMIATLKKGGGIDDTEINLKQTAQDLVDSWTEELSQFKPADRITNADKKNDLKSLQRKLDKHLVLVMNQQLGDEKHYLLPQGTLQAGETLRQAAERVLKQSCGSHLGTKIYGNAPCGFYKYKYPKSIVEETGAIGAKVFMYFARYTNGQIEDNTMDFKWLDRTELKKYLPVPYNSNVMQMLIDE